MLLLCTLLHFSVDGVCAAVMANYAVSEPEFSRIVYYFGIYNLIAFGGQWLAGLFLDKHKALVVPSLAVTPLLLAGGFFGGIFARTVLVATGNCIFHVAAGIIILERSDTFREPGIFVSSGAVGLALGLYRFVRASYFEALCIVCTAIALLVLRKSHRPSSPHELTHNENFAWLIAGALMLLVCVVLRGFGGSSRVPEYVMLMPCVFMLGKSAGGILCDIIGFRKTILAIFVMSCAALQVKGLWGAVILTFAFNMTMPLTLRMLHWYFPEYPGLTFGLAAGCLLPGAFFGKYFGVAPVVMSVMQFLSLFAAGYIFVRYRRGKEFFSQLQ